MFKFVTGLPGGIALFGLMLCAQSMPARAQTTRAQATTAQTPSTVQDPTPIRGVPEPVRAPRSVLRVVAPPDQHFGPIDKTTQTLPNAAVRYGSDAVSLFAQTRRKAEAAPSSRNWWHWHYMFGDLFGLRPALADRGIAIGFYWMGQPAGNPVGGRKQDAKFSQHWDINLIADMGRLLGWEGGTFKLHVINREGGSISNHAVGNWMTIQQIYGAGQDNRMAEMSYTQLAAHKAIELKIGYMPIGNDFGREVYGCDFMNVALCAHPMTLSYDSGWRNNPKAQWGFKIRGNLPKTFYAATGVYQADQYNGGHDNGFKMTFTGSGVVVPMEAGWEPDKSLGMLPGHYRVGGYYENSHLPDAEYDINGHNAGATGNALRLDKGHWGIYGMFDQQLTTFDNDPNRGVVIWGGVGYSNPQMSTVAYSLAAQASVILLGPIRSRPHDLLGIAWGYLEGNQHYQDYLEAAAMRKGKRFIRATHEQLVEIDYGIEVTPWLNLRPNLQYIIHPGGTTQYNDAFAMGLDSKVVF